MGFERLSAQKVTSQTSNAKSSLSEGDNSNDTVNKRFRSTVSRDPYMRPSSAVGEPQCSKRSSREKKHMKMLACLSLGNRKVKTLSHTLDPNNLRFLYSLTREEISNAILLYFDPDHLPLVANLRDMSKDTSKCMVNSDFFVKCSPDQYLLQCNILYNTIRIALEVLYRY